MSYLGRIINFAMIVFPIVVRASVKSNNLFLDTYFQTL